MAIQGIGIDIVEVKRFSSFEKENRFLSDNFTENEIDYCFSYRDPSVHLAGTFAAKEAVYKALGRSDILQSVIEIRREKKGKPSVWIAGRCQKSIFISISHTKDIATAIALKQ